MTPWILAALFALGGILPLIGFWRIARLISKQEQEVLEKIAERGHSNATYGDVQAQYSDIRKPVDDSKKQLFWDVVLVGIGVAINTIASILSVLLTVSP